MRPNAGIQQEIWLLLFEDGDRWTPDDIVEHFAERFPAINRQFIQVLLQNMVARSNTLRKCKDDAGRARFFVNPECNVPVGVRLARLMGGEALPIKAPPANSVFALGAA
jgi:hypothetical protein